MYALYVKWIKDVVANIKLKYTLLLNITLYGTDT